MSSTSAAFIRASSILLISVGALAGATCSSKGSSSPTAPSSSPEAPPASTGTVQITVNPNPVPFSGAPISDAASCAGYANTWFYDQILTEFAGTEVKFTSRVDTFDGKTANNIQGLSIIVPARGTQALKTRWCSGAGVAHTAQTTLRGTDAQGNSIEVIGPVAHLMAPGK